MAAYEKQGESDEWYTPKYIFDALGVSFNLDVACPPEGPRHVPANSFYSEKSLEREWSGFVWMNPPFGHQSTKRLWFRKFFDHGNGIALGPDRTSAPWWQEFHDEADLFLSVSPKVKFERPDWVLPHAKKLVASGMLLDEILSVTPYSKANILRLMKGKDVVESPGTGTTLFASGERAIAALKRAKSLGVLSTPLKRIAA